MERLLFGQLLSNIANPSSDKTPMDLSAAGQSTPRRRRRGAEAIEFALVFPVFLVVLFGTFDYGMLFFTQFQANAVVHASLRAGGLVAPTETERLNGGCEGCRIAVGQAASDALADLGISVPAADLKPELVAVSGVCALVFDADIPNSPIIGMFPAPTSYAIRSSVPAQQVTLCN